MLIIFAIDFFTCYKGICPIHTVGMHCFKVILRACYAEKSFLLSFKVKKCLQDIMVNLVRSSYA